MKNLKLIVMILGLTLVGFVVAMDEASDGDGTGMLSVDDGDGFTRGPSADRDTREDVDGDDQDSAYGSADEDNGGRRAPERPRANGSFRRPAAQRPTQKFTQSETEVTTRAGEIVSGDQIKGPYRRSGGNDVYEEVNGVDVDDDVILNNPALAQRPDPTYMTVGDDDVGSGESESGSVREKIDQLRQSIAAREARTKKGFETLRIKDIRLKLNERILNGTIKNPAELEAAFEDPENQGLPEWYKEELREKLEKFSSPDDDADDEEDDDDFGDELIARLDAGKRNRTVMFGGEGDKFDATLGDTAQQRIDELRGGSSESTSQDAQPTDDQAKVTTATSGSNAQKNKSWLRRKIASALKTMREKLSGIFDRFRGKSPAQKTADINKINNLKESVESSINDLNNPNIGIVDKTTTYKNANENINTINSIQARYGRPDVDTDDLGDRLDAAARNVSVKTNNGVGWRAGQANGTYTGS